MSSVIQTASGLRIVAAHLAPITAISGSKADDGRGLILTAGGDDMIRSWDATTGAVGPVTLRCPGSVVTFLGVVPVGGGHVVVCATSQGVYRWDMASGQPIGEPIRRPELAWARQSGLDQVAVLADGQQPLLVSGGKDGLIRRWDLLTGLEIGTPSAGHDGDVLAIGGTRLADDRLVIVSAGKDLTVRRWDARTGEPIGEPMGRRRGPVVAVTCAAVGKGRDLVITQTVGGSIRRWNAASGEPIGEPMNPGGEGIAGSGLSVTPDGSALLSVGRRGSLWWWDLTVAEPVAQALSGEDDPVNVVAVVAVSDGGPLMVSGGEKGVLRRWDTTGHEVGDPIRAHPSAVGHIVAVPAGSACGGRALLISDGRDGARCWDAATGEPMGTPPYAAMPALYGLAPSWLPDTRLVLATGVHDGVLRHDVFNDQSLGLSAHLEDTEMWEVAAATLPDGTAFVAAASRDGLVYLVDAATGEPLGLPLHGLEDQALAVAVTTLPDGSVMIAAGGEQQMILRWNAVTGEPIGRALVGHDAWVTRLAFLPLPDWSLMLVSVDDDGQVRRWDAISGEPLGEPFHSGGAEEISNVRLAVTAATRPPQLITSGDDEVVRRWDALTGRLLDEVPNALDAAVTTLPDGRSLLAIGATDGSIRISPLPSGAVDPTPGR